MLTGTGNVGMWSRSVSLLSKCKTSPPDTATQEFIWANPQVTTEWF